MTLRRVTCCIGAAGRWAWESSARRRRALLRRGRVAWGSSSWPLRRRAPARSARSCGLWPGRRTRTSASATSPRMRPATTGPVPERGAGNEAPPAWAAPRGASACRSISSAPSMTSRRITASLTVTSVSSPGGRVRGQTGRALRLEVIYRSVKVGAGVRCPGRDRARSVRGRGYAAPQRRIGTGRGCPRRSRPDACSLRLRAWAGSRSEAGHGVAAYRNQGELRKPCPIDW